MLKKLLLLLLISFSADMNAAAPEHKIYEQELEAFKKMPDYQTVFDTESAEQFRSIHRDIENGKKLTWRQKLGIFPLLSLGFIVVTKDTMPELYTTIETMCQQAQIAMPTIFISMDTGVLNAAAFKLFTSGGCIIIMQKIIQKMSDQELNAVLAHEIGHIKHNHVNKRLALMAALLIPAAVVSSILVNQVKDWIEPTVARKPEWMQDLAHAQFYVQTKILLPLLTSALVSDLIIGKEFEKEADAVAYKDFDKGPDLIKAFEKFAALEQKIETDFEHTYQKLEKDKEALGFGYGPLLNRLNEFNFIYRVKKWLRDHTPLMPHPSPADRIATIQQYLDTQKAV